MKTAKMNINDIRPADYNPRVNLSPGDPDWESLTKSLDRFGLVEPLIINERTGNLVSGHQRLNALREMNNSKVLGAEPVEAEVVLIDIDPDREKALNIALNKIEGMWDYDKLEELLSEFSDEDLEYTGFSAEELDNLFNDEGLQEEIDAGEELAGKAAQEADEEQETDETFEIYLSFPSKEEAEQWLSERDLDAEYRGAVRNVTIQMEGSEYGTGY